MYLIDKNSELTIDYLSKVLLSFQTKELPKLNKLLHYYEGKQDILLKEATDVGKPNNKIVVNYCYNIVQNYLGYLAGVPISYENDELSEIIDVLNYNDVNQEDNELLRQALIYGKSYEINYIDENGKQRFRLLDTIECIPIYANDLNNELLYVIRFYREDLLNSENYIVEVYGAKDTKYYRSAPGFASFALIDTKPNYYGQCPITVFSLNKDEESIFNQIISLQDSYNQLLSDEVDDFDAFCDAYLMLKGVIADADDLTAMKKNKVLMIDADAEAGYLTKNVSDTQIENMLTNINTQIHKISNSPDFTDEKFMAQSGIALKYKLVGFENTSSDIESYMRRALQRRIELICSILRLTNEEQLWRDVNIVFTRNLPQSLEPSNPSELMVYRGLVSDKTLLAQIPFVNNVDEELEENKKQIDNNLEEDEIEENKEEIN